MQSSEVKIEIVRRVELVVKDGRKITRQTIETRTILITKGTARGSGYVADEIIAEAKRAAEEYFCM